jgi:hypothetical protein
MCPSLSDSGTPVNTAGRHSCEALLPPGSFFTPSTMMSSLRRASSDGSPGPGLSFIQAGSVKSVSPPVT